jgi:hypothetical protein
MKTGFDPTGNDNDMYESHLKTLIDIVTPVVERAIVLSCETGEDEDIDDLDIIDDDSIEFVRYSGDDPAFKAINEAYDAWDSWKPQSPVEELLKNAINSNEHCGGMVNE